MKQLLIRWFITEIAAFSLNVTPECQRSREIVSFDPQFIEPRMRLKLIFFRIEVIFHFPYFW